MTALLLTDAAIYLDAIDLSGYSNEIGLAWSRDALENSTFGSASRTFGAGARQLAVSGGGYYEAAEPDATLFTQADGGATVVASFAVGTSENDVAYAAQAIRTSYDIGGTYGDWMEWSGAMQTSGATGRGYALLEKQTVTGDTTSTGAQFAGGVAAGESMALAVHCFTAGTTATVKLQSDDNGSYTSATDRVTKTVTATGATWTTVSGAVTDDYWRVDVSSVTGTFSLAVVAVLLTD